LYSDVKLVYSTPGKFLDAIKKENVNWPVWRDDMFPYADEKHAYWTGYFTSWPVGKGLFRDLSRLSHVMDNKDALSILGTESYSELINQHEEWNQVIGALQHHDAITGTAKQAV